MFLKDILIIPIALGDLRNVIISVTNLPENYKRLVNIIINDKDIDIVIRNVILLFNFLIIDKPQITRKYSVYIFYSTFIIKLCHNTLQIKIKPFVQDVYNKITNRSPDILLNKIWKFGKYSLRLIFTKEE